VVILLYTVWLYYYIQCGYITIYSVVILLYTVWLYSVTDLVSTALTMKTLFLACTSGLSLPTPSVEDLQL